MLYTLFIDETGDHTMRRCNEFEHRFLSLTGVLVSREHERAVIIPELADLKAKHIGDDTHPLHRSDIVHAENGYEPLAVVPVRDAFDSDLLTALESWQYRVWSVCLDKKAHFDKFGMWRHPPYHYCLAILLEKVGTYLDRFKHQADVIVEARYKKVDRQLKRRYRKLYQHGTAYVDGARFQRVFTNSNLKMKPKTANYAGLQLADIFAYPSKLEILRDHEIVDDEGNAVPLTSFSTSLCDLLGNKYDQWKGNVYGKKLL